MDFWTLPKVEEKKKNGENEITPEKLEKMTPDEFIELGEEKIAAFLESSGAPKQFSADKVINMVKEGKITPERMAKMMSKMAKPKSKGKGNVDQKLKSLIAFSDKFLQGKGYVNWEEFDHPTAFPVDLFLE